MAFFVKITGIKTMVAVIFFFCVSTTINLWKVEKYEHLTIRQSPRNEFQFWTNIQICKENPVRLIY